MHIRPFEIALIGTFVLMALVGLFFLANYQSKQSAEALLYGQRVSIWGTFDARIIQNLLTDLKQTNKALEVVEYTQVDERTFDTQLINALAEGRAPDLVIMPHTLLVTYRTKLEPISFQTIPQRAFRDTYIDGAEIFMRSDGVYGIPFAVDPLVMYWNRDIFSSSGLATPPRTWEALLSQTTKAIVQRDTQSNITQSAVAFGEYSNVRYAKDILAMLLMQAGTTIVDEDIGGYRVTLADGLSGQVAPGDAAVTFYTQFAIPNRDLYSWSRSKRLDRTEFLNGTLGMYFGKGSEQEALLRENSNLNFDMASVPQGSGATTRRNYGDFYAFVIPRASQNKRGAYAVALVLSNPANTQVLLDGYMLAPAHRSLYGQATDDPFKSVRYENALIARGWLDPSPQGSNDVLRRMVEGVTGGSARLRDVIIDASQELELLF